MQAPLNVVTYSDGRPGHIKQTRAVVSAMAALTPLSIDARTLTQTVGLRRVFQGLNAFMASGKSSSAHALKRVDLIIGAGSMTHLPMIALKWRYRAKLVTCMAPDPLLRMWFDLCLIPRHDNPPARRNIFTTFGPPCMKVDHDRHDATKGLILAGGLDPKSHYWDTSSFLTQIEALFTILPEISWTVSSSPRTPADTVAQLRRSATERHNVSFFSADETPQGWIESAYKLNDQVWVTADSVSMVYEALSAGCRVGILPVAWKQPRNKFQRGLDDLSANGLVLDFVNWQKGQPWPEIPNPLNEAERCALEILRRWWPQRLA